jgi:hypothetical protein
VEPLEKDAAVEVDGRSMVTGDRCRIERDRIDPDEVGIETDLGVAGRDDGLTDDRAEDVHGLV